MFKSYYKIHLGCGVYFYDVVSGTNNDIKDHLLQHKAIEISRYSL